MAGRELEVEVVKLEGGGGDVDAKEGGWIAIEDLDRRIQGEHIRWYPTGIHPSLYIKILKQNVLSTPYHHTTQFSINGYTLKQTFAVGDSNISAPILIT